MSAIDLKLIRDFRRLWVQGLAIALVLACGVAILLMAWGMARALEDTRAAYYERNRFAHVFADARRAPLSLVPAIRAIEGVATVEPRGRPMPRWPCRARPRPRSAAPCRCRMAAGPSSTGSCCGRGAGPGPPRRAR